jgi:hypothetical protein
MYPEGVCKDGQQQGNRDEFAAAPAPEARAPGFHFMHVVPGIARKRPIRAVLLATAVVAVSYSLVRHHDRGPETMQRANAPLSAPAPTAGFSSALSIDSRSGDASSDSWNPPVGIDRSHQALDRLTLDLSPAPQTRHPASGFQAKPNLVSLPPETAQRADAPQPAGIAQHADPTQPSLAQPPSVQEAAPAREEAQQEGPAAPAEVPDRPAAPPASAPATPPSPKKVRWRNEIDEYLWGVYQRSATKRDASGDFTWKDEAAAARMGLVTKQYVIGGMDLDFRELLYNLGHAMDADGLRWTILSGFRDDYRQSLASGYKARVGNSFHGGSRATGGYGHGCAADIEAVDGESDSAVWKWVDQHGEKFGVFRPMKQIDPAHIQPFGAWHDVALNLRTKDVQNAYLPANIDGTDAEKPPVTSLVDTRSGVSEAQFDCVRSHGGHFRLAARHGFPGGHMHRAVLVHGGRMHRFGRRRMIVIIGGPEKHASMETVTDQSDAAAKAQASGKNRRDAKPRNVAADAGHTEKSARKEASQNANRAQHSAKAPEAKAQKIADSKHPQKRAADAKASQAKAKSHVADRQDGPSSKKL